MKDVRLGRALRGVTLRVRAGEIVGIAGVEGQRAARAGARAGGPRGARRRRAALRSGGGGARGPPRRGPGSRCQRARQPRARRARALHADAASSTARRVEREARARLRPRAASSRRTSTPPRSRSRAATSRRSSSRAPSRAPSRDACPSSSSRSRRAASISAPRERSTARSRGPPMRATRSSSSAPTSASFARSADRILVMARGRIVAELPPDAPDAQLGEAMLGGARRRSRGGARVSERTRRATARRPLPGIAAGWLALALLVWIYGESPREVAAKLVSRHVGDAVRRGAGALQGDAAAALGRGRGSGAARGAVQHRRRGAARGGGARRRHRRCEPAGPGRPAWIALPVVIAVAPLAGAAWAAMPAVLRARFGAHEVISTIMMNRIADAAVALGLAARSRHSRAPCARRT